MANIGTVDEIPKQLLYEIMKVVLSHKGKTIKTIEHDRGRSYKGDASQKKYRNKSVWHTKESLMSGVGKELKLDPKTWAPENTPNDFSDGINSQIIKLRKKEYVADWSKGKSITIYRLKPHVRTTKKQKMSIAKKIPTHEKNWIIGTGSDNESAMMKMFLYILVRGKKDTTYKFAFARAMLEYCKDKKHFGDRDVIPYRYFAGKFLKYFWHQICRFKIRQDFHVKRTPRLITAICKICHDRKPVKFKKLPSEDKKIVEDEIMKSLFGHSTKRSSYVVHKFQNIVENRQKKEIRMFYDYDDDEQEIRLKPGVFEFFHKYNEMLTMVTILEWAKFLEKANNSLPKLIAKVEKEDERRGSLAKFRQIYLRRHNPCFYCKVKIAKKCINVDHFIPWRYMLSNDAWNLVLACKKCNCKKHDSLPDRKFLHKLIARNEAQYNSNKKLKKSLTSLDPDEKWKTVIKEYYQKCKDSKFQVRIFNEKIKSF